MTTRRSFVKQAATLTAGMWLAPNFAMKHKQKKIGIQLWTVREIIEKDPKGVLEKIAKIGYKEVEPYGFSLEDNFLKMQPKELKIVLDANGLKAPSGHYSFNEYFHKGDRTVLDAAIKEANTLESEFITISSIDEKLKKDAETCKQTAKKFNEIGAICKKSGLKLAYHNHNTEFRPFGNTYGYEIFLKETDPKLMHFEMDIYWLVRAGKDPLAMFKEFPHRFPMWHVKDMDKKNHDDNTEIGNGTIDFKAIFKHAKESGMKHFFLEQESNYQPNIMDSIATSYAYMKKELV